MKFSIITPCLNAEHTIRLTLNSILSQSYRNIEHVIVDGGSIDRTKEIIKKYPHANKKIYTLKKSSIYQAINLGIKKSTGDIVCILNADDIFNSNTIIEMLAKIIKRKKYDMYLGNVVFFKNTDFAFPVRFYGATKYKREMILNSLMPPHPGCFVKRQVYDKFCLYNENLKVASDYNFFLQTLIKFKLKFYVINKTVVRMKLGGVSTRNVFSFFYNSFEIFKSFKINKIDVPYLSIILRIPFKLGQYVFLNVKKLNKEFEFPKIKFEKDYFESREIKIIKNINRIINKNFVISAMNLAFLGSYAQKKVSLYKELYHWPDGVFAYRNFRSKKIAGRDFFKNIKLPMAINKIIVLGNLSKKSHNYLTKKFALPIKHIELPYASVEIICKSIKLRLSKNSLVFITLPTPKQEILAEFLTKNNKFFKIICIGASIAMLSGEEAPVPKFLYKLEFLWRLKFETRRRILRLATTYYHYMIGKFINKSFIYNYVSSFDKNEQ